MRRSFDRLAAATRETLGQAKLELSHVSQIRFLDGGKGQMLGCVKEIKNLGTSRRVARYSQLSHPASVIFAMGRSGRSESTS